MEDGTHLAFPRDVGVVALRVDADVLEPVRGPAQRGAVQVGEPAALHLVADDGDLGRPPAGVLVEAREGEEQVLVRVERVIFGRRAQK